MIALNVYKNLCRVRPRSFATSLAHLSNIVFNGSSSVYDKRSDWRLLEKPIFQQCRCYNTDSQTKPGVQLPPFFESPKVYSLGVFKSIFNFIYIVITMPQIDKEFDLNTFIIGAKKALHVVSHALACEDYESIEGLVTNDSIQKLRERISMFDSEQKKIIALDAGDVVKIYPYKINITEDEHGLGNSRPRRLVTISVAYIVLPGMGEMLKRGEGPTWITMEKDVERLLACNYSFVREYIEGVDSPWIINDVNHFPLQQS